MESCNPMSYRYKIYYVNKKNRWIYIESDDSWDFEEPDSFIYLLGMIQKSIGGRIERVGDDQFVLSEDEQRLIFQWDGCFGITVIYPKSIPEEAAITFLSRYMSEF